MTHFGDIERTVSPESFPETRLGGKRGGAAGGAIAVLVNNKPRKYGDKKKYPARTVRAKITPDSRVIGPPGLCRSKFVSNLRLRHSVATVYCILAIDVILFATLRLRYAGTNTFAATITDDNIHFAGKFSILLSETFLTFWF